MVFCSVEFLLYFLPVFLFLYAITPERCKNVILLLGSLLFYSFGEERYLLLLMMSVLVNYGFGRFIGISNRENSETIEEWRKGILAFAITINVGILLIFKVALPAEELPLGVSFYTFQILSYLIDVYRREIPGEPSLIKLATYVTMFPQLIAGPIVNYDEVSEQLSHRRMTYRSLQSGLKVFTLGLVAKVLLADRIGLLWNDIQVRGFESITTPMAWLGAFSYSMKLYFDFYGYSLMAIGLGIVMGFNLPENFKHPYMARSIREFYRRWHVTLGRWFCKYIYIPMGGNRHGELCTVRNLLVVWALTGLWHGGRGNFLLWGIVLWALIVIERQISRFLEKHPVGGESISRQMTVLPHLYVLLVIPVTWMFFAISDVKDLGIYLGRLFGAVPTGPVLMEDWKIALQSYGGLFVVCLIASTPIVRNLYGKFKHSNVVNVILAILFWICVWRVMVEGNNPFMYFKF